MYTDLLTLATDFVLRPDVNFNPGLPLTTDFRPITLSPTLGDADPDTIPGTNIYRAHTPYRNDAYLTSASINAKVIYAVMKGGKGNSTDYLGALMIAFFQRNPDEWSNLFYSRHARMTPTDLLINMTGASSMKASGFINCAAYLFESGDDLDPRKHETALRSILRF